MESTRNKFDVIIIGAGIGGLSVANFLAKYEKKVLVLEKHNIAGGYLTSFSRKNYQFDSGVFHLTDMGEQETIPMFNRFWGNKIESKKVNYKFKIFIGNNSYIIDGKTAQNDLVKYFPSDEKAIKYFFDLSTQMMTQTLSMGAPKAPFDMSFWEKLSFGIKTMIKNPKFLRFGRKNGQMFFKKLFKDKNLATIIYSYYPISSLILFGFSFGWSNLLRDENYYPTGGMQAIPDAMVTSLKENQGEIKLKAEVKRILIEKEKAIGVECLDGSKYYANTIISNSPIHYTLNKLLDGYSQFDSQRKQIAKREIFCSVMLDFLGMDEKYDYQGTNFFIIMDEKGLELKEEDLTPKNCPILMIVLPKSEKQKGDSILIGVFLPYEYNNYWSTNNSKIRGEEYKKTKEEVFKVILERITQKLGKDFQQAIKFSLASTPLTLERYTYNEKGSIMGWKMDKKNYGKFLRHETVIDNLYFVGQWTFPGGGVPGAMAGGYYLAKNILAEDNIDLEAEFAKKMK